MNDFTGLDLIEPLQRAIAAEGYSVPTPIQAQSIPLLNEGRDLLGIAQTGTGKTAAFVLPLLQRLDGETKRPVPGSPRALILAPTRELAGQIQTSLCTYGRHLKLKSTVVFGGVPIGKQIKIMRSGVDVLVATPGRLLDLMNQGQIKLDRVEVFILDEADRMFDMGFINDVRKIAAKLPKRRQTVLFSATMPDEVHKLASGVLTDPVRVEVAPQSTTVERIEQRVMFVDRAKKNHLLSELMNDKGMARVIIFTRTKHGADRVARHLERDGVVSGVIHGNKSQNARERALHAFRSGRVRALVATDIAARGIDIDDVTHVINFDLPHEPESYVHRIGRTARAGADGMAISFCDEDQKGLLLAIEKTTQQNVSVHTDHSFHAPHIADAPAKAGQQPRRGKPGGGRNGKPKGKPSGKRNEKPGGKPGGNGFAAAPKGKSQHRKGGGKPHRSGGNKRGGSQGGRARAA